MHYFVIQSLVLSACKQRPFSIKQGRKRLLDTPKRMIERREREGERERQGERKRDKE